VLCAIIKRLSPISNLKMVNATHRIVLRRIIKNIKNRGKNARNLVTWHWKRRQHTLFVPHYIRYFLHHCITPQVSIPRENSGFDVYHHQRTLQLYHHETTLLYYYQTTLLFTALPLPTEATVYRAVAGRGHRLPVAFWVRRRWVGVSWGRWKTGSIDSSDTRVGE
jgi:hypothetical protein